MPRAPIDLPGITPQVPLSLATRAGDFIFVSGMVSLDLDHWQVVEGEIEAQTARTLDNIGRVLAEAGATLDDVVKVQAYLADMALFPRFNAVYQQYFARPLPSRTTVAVLLSGFLVEVDVVAYVGQG